MVTPDEGGWFRSVVPFAVADALALIAFVLVGARSHDQTDALGLLLRNAVPLEVMWFAAAAVFGTYRRPGLRTLLTAWIVAVPAAIVVRSLWVGSPSGVRLLTFVGIGLAFTLASLLVGRAAAGFAGRRNRSRSRVERGSIAP